jgi:putative endonuclease
MFWVYVLENSRGTFYVGQTGNIENRLVDHNRTDSFDGHFTRKNGPWKLVWLEEHPSRNSATRRERQIKRMKSANWIRSHLLARNAAAVNPDESGL